MVYPVVGDWRISSPYGDRVLNGEKQFHDGVDFAGSIDNTVVSIADGVVVYDQDDYEEALRWVDKHHSAGNMVILRHVVEERIYYARYLHLIKNFVGKGDTVYEGGLIGTYGDVGYSFGAHLHFDLYDETWKKLNPMDLLGKIDLTEEFYEEEQY